MVSRPFDSRGSMLNTLNTARPGSLDSATDAAITWRYMVPPGHTLEDCMRPDYFKNCVREAGYQRIAGRHAWNKIELLADDGTWEAMLRVMSVGDGLVTTRLLSHWQEEPKKKLGQVPDGYRVEFIKENGWRALEPGGAMLGEKLPTKAEATDLAINHATKARGRT